MCCATAALAGLVLTTTAIALQNKRTTFTEAELWGIYGGGEMAEKCCKDLALCRFVTDQCDDWTGNGDPFLNMEKCEKSNQVDTFVGNRKFCLFLQPGANCLETGTHICSRKTRCKWDADDQTCKLSNIDPFEMTAPVKCVPVCPQRPGF